MTRSAAFAFHLRRAWFAWTFLLSLAWVWAGGSVAPLGDAPRGAAANMATATAMAEVAPLARTVQAQQPSKAWPGGGADLALPLQGLGFGPAFGSAVARVMADTGHAPTRPDQRPEPRAPPAA